MCKYDKLGFYCGLCWGTISRQGAVTSWSQLKYNIFNLCFFSLLQEQEHTDKYDTARYNV